jgi:hypothetical protein
MLMERAKEYRALRAPAGDGETVIDPPLVEVPGAVERNRAELSLHGQYDLQGRPLVDLSTEARAELFVKALRYTSQYRNIAQRWLAVSPVTAKPFVLSGHQPELFHPGVWYKNFVLGSLSKQMNGVGIHLLIDSDTCRTASIRVPTGSVEHPRVEAVAYDEPAVEVPYEERMIRDAAAFSTFAERASSMIWPFVHEPLVAELWQLVMERNPAQKNLGLRLAQGRHALEETWNNQTLELPQSAVCELPEFAWFVSHILAHLPRFWAAHNDALAHYRRAHRMRGHAQPVPDLDASDGWLEAPFWIWTASDPERRPLYARQSGDELVITDRHEQTISLRLSADGDAGFAVEQLLELPGRGIKLRTRALTTTLFARLVLSDLFLHGIGGAKYDQVMDHIVRSFFGFEPPEFATVSATLRLPIEHVSSDGSADGQWQQRLRELEYHPERFIQTNGEAPADAAELVVAKRRWVETAKTPENASERHRGIVAANVALQPFVATLRERVEREQVEVEQLRRGEKILRSREYSFCLYPRRNFEALIAGVSS